MHQALHKSEFGVLRLSPLNGLKPWRHSELYTSYRAVRSRCHSSCSPDIGSLQGTMLRYHFEVRIPSIKGALDLVEHLCQLTQSAALCFPAMQASLEPRSGSGNESSVGSCQSCQLHMHRVDKYPQKLSQGGGRITTL